MGCVQTIRQLEFYKKKKYTMLLCVVIMIAVIYLHLLKKRTKTNDKLYNLNFIQEQMPTDSLVVLLNDLDTYISSKFADTIYGNVLSSKDQQQIVGYMSAMNKFNRDNLIKSVCEIGFGGGHSATLFLHSTDASVTYTAFDTWDRPIYEDVAMKWVKEKFPDRIITLIKGDSVTTVPSFSGTCDIIHIGGAHLSGFRKIDILNMERLASSNNLLLINKCMKSWPAVQEGVEFLTENNLVSDLNQYESSGWFNVGAKTGWCIGQYRTNRTLGGPVSNFLKMTNNKSKIGDQTIVFLVSKLNYTSLQREIDMATVSLNTKHIVVIITDELQKSMLERLNNPKIKIISSQNLKTDQSSYTASCLHFSTYLTIEMLQGSDTVCNGTDRITVVLMGFSPKRLHNYDTILPAYSKMKIIDQIILIWNNQNVPFSIKSKVNITFIQAAENTMNNRYDVYTYVRTDAFLIIDDDVLVSEPLLHLMVLRWNENRGRLLGLDGRFVTSKNDYKYRIKSQIPSIVIGKTMLFHRKYLNKYMADIQLVEWNRFRFCEDIAMNGLIQKATNLKPLVVVMDNYYKRTNLADSEGISISKNEDEWLHDRSTCVSWVSKYFDINMQ